VGSGAARKVTGYRYCWVRRKRNADRDGLERVDGLDDPPARPHAEAMTVLPFPLRGDWVHDVRGEGRAARVSAHAEAGVVVVSVWNGDTCTATVRLAPEGVLEAVTALTRGLVELQQLRASAGHG